MRRQMGVSFKEGGNICIPMADSCRFLALTTKFCKAIILQLKNKYIKKTPGTQHCTLADRLHKAIPNKQTSQNLILDMALPFRETRSSSIHRHKSLNQEIFTRHCSNSTHWRQTPKLRATTFQSAERRPQAK